MVPLISECDLERSNVLRNPRRIYLLYEGQNTEPLLINSLLSNNPLFKKTPVIFAPISKTGNDEGDSQPAKLIAKAKEFISDSIRKRSFISGRDKVMIVFDLDVMKNDQVKMDGLLASKTKDLILAYTNPAIELFILLSKPRAYETIIEPNKKEIIANRKVILPNGKEGEDRFVLSLVKKEFRIDPKDRDADFRFAISNIDNAMKEERHLNHCLSKAANQLTSNICYVLTKIKDGKIDEISY